jgi:hypothetical protein
MNFARNSVSLARKPPASSKRLSREQRHALKMLANAPRGVSEEVLVVAHGFSAEMIADLVIAGLATVVAEMKKAPRGLTIKIERIRITDEGRKTLGD